MAYYNASPTSSEEEAQASPPSQAIVFNNTQERLQYLSKQFVDAMNTNTFREVVYRLLTPDFSGVHEQDDDQWTFSGREGLIKHMETFLARNPMLYTEILNSTAEVDERRGTGRVFILRSVVGLAGGVKKEAFMELHWVRFGGVGGGGDGEWLCSGYRGLRGFSFFGSVECER